MIRLCSPYGGPISLLLLLMASCGGSNDTAASPSTDAATDAVADAAPSIPRIALSTGELDFGGPLVGSENTIDLVILSVGDADLIVSVVTLQEDDPLLEYQASPSGDVSLVIPPGESRAIEITLSPLDDDADTGRVTVFSNDPDASSVVAELLSEITGDVAIETCVLLGDEPDSQPGASCAEPEQIDFDGIAYGTTDSHLVRIRNIGSDNRPLELQSVGLAGDTGRELLFTIDLFRTTDDSKEKEEEPVSLPVLISPTDDVVFSRITFTADIDGLVPTEVLRIQTNDKSDPQHDIAFSGTVVGCPDGFVDENNDLSDGCEYPCYFAGDETCNGADDDCDTTTDEGCNVDGDAYCTALMTTFGAPSVCTSGGGDCDDGDAAVHPGATEVCNDIDDDCSGTIDDGDNDCGGVCTLAAELGTPCDGTDADLCLEGAFECAGPNEVECGDVTIGNVEVCNSVDDDCDDDIDEGCNSDGDVYCTDAVNTFGTPPICLGGGGDCDDGNADVNPGATETCNDIDDDCSGAIDDGDNACDGVCTLDAAPGTACDGLDGDLCPEGEFVCAGRNDLACSDATDDTVETCNGLDDNCDGTIDEGENACFGVCALLTEPGVACDVDESDDVDTCLDDVTVCAGLNDTLCVNAGTDADGDGASAGATDCGGDCDETNPARFPGNPEICDLIDNDCDDFVDEGCPCEEFVFDGGGATTEWENPLNWSPDGVPGHAINHCVTIPAGFTVTISAQPENALGTFALHGTLTHPAADTDGVEILVGDTATIGSTGMIDAVAKGFGPVTGPGAGSNGVSYDDCNAGIAASGAGHGGLGGKGQNGVPSGGAIYGTLSAPIDLGSGGGSRNPPYVSNSGGRGGGRVRLVVGGALTLDGTIRADGGSGTSCSASGGSGGSIWITAAEIESSSDTATITADGGAGLNETGCRCGAATGGGGGAGGRIAIDGWSDGIPESLVIHARGGAGGGAAQRGAAGTVLLRAATAANGDLIIDNGGLAGATTPFGEDAAITFANVTVSGRASVEWSDLDDISIADTVVVAEASTLSTALPLTPEMVTVDGTLAASSGDADGVTITATMVTVGATGMIDAVAKGFGPVTGPGAGSNGVSYDDCNAGIAASGAGHGGLGGKGQNGVPSGGASYGTLSAPIDLGSGGGSRNPPYVSNSGGRGGGRVRLVVDTLALDGTIRADGGSGTSCSASGGSGGSIWITAAEIESSSDTATITADGGAGLNETGCRCGAATGGGGGAGGRIAIDGWSDGIPESLVIHARGGAGGGAAQRGAAGTVLLHAATAANGDLIIDNDAAGGAITPLSGTAAWTFDNVTIGADTTIETIWLDAVATMTLDGVLTHEAASASGLRVTADMMTISATGIVDANAKGYGAAAGPGTGSNGPSYDDCNALAGSGGGHGAVGGSGQSGVPTGGALYGSAQGAPVDLGSGGGSRNPPYVSNSGGTGGGRIRIEVDGTLTINGAVRASGSDASSCSAGGGAGGSIWITSSTIETTGGAPSILAEGGDGMNETGCRCGSATGGGGGAGGRISILVDANELPPSATVSTAGGSGAGGGAAGGVGARFHFPGVDSLVTLTAPTDAGAGVAAGTALSWGGYSPLETGHYHVELDDDEHFDASAVHPETGAAQIATVNETSGMAGGPLTVTSWTTPALSAGTTYYWRVVLHNSAGGVIGGSPTFQFTTP